MPMMMRAAGPPGDLLPVTLADPVCASPAARRLRARCGGVGRELLKQVLNMKERANVLAVADSREIILSAGAQHDDVLAPEAVEGIIAAKESRSGLSSVGGDVNVLPLDAGLRSLLSAAPPSCTVLADCTATDSVNPYIASALEHGYGVALANKKPVTSDQAFFDSCMAYKSQFRWESTCGAGTPFISSLHRLCVARDTIHKVSGAFSGTLGYVMSGLEAGQAFSEVVAEAKGLGYTEPDPRDDLNGMDVARKALILARMQGWKLELADVEVESLFPESMSPENMSLEEFMATGLPALDAKFQGLVEAAKAKGCALRYAATVENGTCKVGPVEAPKDSALGSLQGTGNIMEVTSDIYTSPLVITGAGAGVECTAMGVLADVMNIHDGSQWGA